MEPLASLDTVDWLTLILAVLVAAVLAILVALPDEFARLEEDDENDI